MNLQLSDISDNNNKIESSLQELELTILNILGLQKFKWNNFKDIKRKSAIEELLRKTRLLIDNSHEVRETARQLNKELLRLQLSTKNLELFLDEIREKSDQIKIKLDGIDLSELKDSEDEATETTTTEDASDELIVTRPELHLTKKEKSSDSKPPHDIVAETDAETKEPSINPNLKSYKLIDSFVKDDDLSDTNMEFPTNIQVHGASSQPASHFPIGHSNGGDLPSFSYQNIK
jgi:hypothetical protein